MPDTPALTTNAAAKHAQQLADAEEDLGAAETVLLDLRAQRDNARKAVDEAKANLNELQAKCAVAVREYDDADKYARRLRPRKPRQTAPTSPAETNGPDPSLL